MQKCVFLKTIRIPNLCCAEIHLSHRPVLISDAQFPLRNNLQMEQYPVLANYQTPDLNRSFVKVRAKSITTVAWEHPFSEDQFVHHFTSIAISQPRVNWKQSEASEWGWIWLFLTPVFLADFTRGWEWIRLRAHFPSNGSLLSDCT